MLNYKGYEIPNTIEEIIENNKPEKNRDIWSIPSITYEITPGTLINTTISVERINNISTEEEKAEVIDRYLEVLKSYIDYAERRDRGYKS